MRPWLLAKLDGCENTILPDARDNLGRGERGVARLGAPIRPAGLVMRLDVEQRQAAASPRAVHFLERTSLDELIPDANIKLTIPDGFDRMLEHIAVHHYFMGLDERRDIPEEEAVTHWYDTVYRPIVQIIRRSAILKGFPGKTEGDLYLWVLDRQEFLSRQGNDLMPPDQAAREFIQGAVK